MPTYGYRCQSCASEFEVWQRMTDEARADCPGCGGAGRRMFFPAGIVFKGGGFYKTDSRGAEASSPAAKPADGAPGKDGSAAGKEAGKEAGTPAQPVSAEAATSHSPVAPSTGAAASRPAPTTPSAPPAGSPPGKSA